VQRQLLTWDNSFHEPFCYFLFLIFVIHIWQALATDRITLFKSNLTFILHE
jgi:hypothetical protein